MSSQDGDGPSGILHLRVLRVTWRRGRLVVRSGLPTIVAVLAIAAIPGAALAIGLTGGWGSHPAAPLALCVVTPLFLWTMGGPWTLTLDRRAGWATLWRGPWRTRRSLEGLVGVRVSSLHQAQIERVRRRRQVMPYAPLPDLACGVALVDPAGKWWCVTRSQDRAYGAPTPSPAEADQVARRVADYLEIPFLPPYQTPPGGQVPPLLEERPPATAA
jgi:hypothetical protein